MKHVSAGQTLPACCGRRTMALQVAGYLGQQGHPLKCNRLSSDGSFRTLRKKKRFVFQIGSGGRVANARMGSVETEHMGGLCAEEQHIASDYLYDFWSATKCGSRAISLRQMGDHERDQPLDRVRRRNMNSWQHKWSAAVRLQKTMDAAHA